jgi:hypothetical protein
VARLLLAEGLEILGKGWMTMDLDSTLLFGLLAAVAVVLVMLCLRNDAARREERAVQGSIMEYFQDLEIKVIVTCLKTKQGLIVLVDAEPHKRFRFSYVKERVLAELVAKVTGKQVEKIYWRFHLPQEVAGPDAIKDYPDYEAPAAPLTQAPSLAKVGWTNKDFASYEVGEISWESYEQAMKPV